MCVRVCGNVVLVREGRGRGRENWVKALETAVKLLARQINSIRRTVAKSRPPCHALLPCYGLGGAAASWGVCQRVATGWLHCVTFYLSTLGAG